VAAIPRQNQVRQLKDTWPIDGLCIYNYQLATQIDRRDKFINPDNSGQILITGPGPAIT